MVGFGDEAIDGGLEIDEGMEDTPLEASFCEFGEERRGSVALAVMGHVPRRPLLHGQARRGAVERLDLAFFVNGQDDGVGGRIDVKPTDIAQFADEVRIVRELELPTASCRWLRYVCPRNVMVCAVLKLGRLN